MELDLAPSLEFLNIRKNIADLSISSRVRKMFIGSFHPDVFKTSIAIRMTAKQESNQRKYTIVPIPTTLTQLKEQILRKERESTLPKAHQVYNQVKTILNLEEQAPQITPVIILMWNCRGAASHDFNQAFRDMVDFHKPSMSLLKLNWKQLELVRSYLIQDFHIMLLLRRKGFRGGCCFMDK